MTGAKSMTGAKLQCADYCAGCHDAGGDGYCQNPRRASIYWDGDSDVRPCWVDADKYPCGQRCYSCSRRWVELYCN